MRGCRLAHLTVDQRPGTAGVARSLCMRALRSTNLVVAIRLVFPPRHWYKSMSPATSTRHDNTTNQCSGSPHHRAWAASTTEKASPPPPRPSLRCSAHRGAWRRAWPALADKALVAFLTAAASTVVPVAPAAASVGAGRTGPVVCGCRPYRPRRLWCQLHRPRRLWCRSHQPQDWEMHTNATWRWFGASLSASRCHQIDQIDAECM